jgi:DNA-binding NarL/FixJ family response regulator
MTGDERRVFELFSQGRRTDEVAAHLGISRDQVVELMLAVLAKLQARSTPPDPPPPPLAASAALAIPYQRAEDLPRHVGRVFPRKRSPRSPTR